MYLEIYCGIHGFSLLQQNYKKIIQWHKLQEDTNIQNLQRVNHMTPPIFAMENCDTISFETQDLNRKKIHSLD